MKHIQWFPGHMAKARKEVIAQLKLVDIVIEVVDARLPVSSQNPMLEDIIQNKPKLMLLNKADLADSNQTKQWIDYFKQHGIVAIAINAKQNNIATPIIKACQEILKDRIEKRKAKGLKPKAIRAMIIGIPNVGKSTLLNQLIRKKIAKTGNKPGVTKAQQWLKLNGVLELLDTPGILWPKFDDDMIGLKLALSGAIKDDILAFDDVALYALAFFEHYYSQQIHTYLNLEDAVYTDNYPEQLLAFSKQRGFKDDYDRASLALIQDIRNGKLGRYTLDRVEDME